MNKVLTYALRELFRNRVVSLKSLSLGFLALASLHPSAYAVQRDSKTPPLIIQDVDSQTESDSELAKEAETKIPSAKFFRSFKKRFPKINTDNSAAQLLDSAAAITIKTNPVRVSGLQVAAIKIGPTVHIDGRLPKTFKGSDGQPIPIDGYLAVYASVQRAIVNQAGMSEASAHEFGVIAIRELVRATGQNWIDVRTLLRGHGYDMIPHAAKILAATNELVEEGRGTLSVLVNYDIPYLAGYSHNNPKKIYLDKDLPRKAKTASGKIMDLYPPLVIHEAFEKALIDELRLPGNRYHRSHQIAQRMEKAVVQASGFTWTDYQKKVMKPEIEKAINKWENYRERVKDSKVDRKTLPSVTPRDLDLTPYINEKDFDLIEDMKSIARD